MGYLIRINAPYTKYIEKIQLHYFDSVHKLSFHTYATANINSKLQKLNDSLRHKLIAIEMFHENVFYEDVRIIEQFAQQRTNDDEPFYADNYLADLINKEKNPLLENC